MKILYDASRWADARIHVRLFSALNKAISSFPTKEHVTALLYDCRLLFTESRHLKADVLVVIFR